MSLLDYNYEFAFTGGVFNSTIYNMCGIVDASGNRIGLVQNIITETQTLFTNTPGIKHFSTFFNYTDGNRYKVTVTNMNFH